MNTYKLMLEDTEVAIFNLENIYIDVWKHNLLPMSVRLESYTSELRYVTSTISRLKLWLSRRLLPASRKHADKIFQIMGLNDYTNIDARATKACGLHALSVNDCYWVKPMGSTLSWSEINLRNYNVVNISETSLLGEEYFGAPIEMHPDFFTDGKVAKTWVNRQDGLHLIKGGVCAEYEVYASKLLDCFRNVNHVQYTNVTGFSRPHCDCKVIERPDNMSIVSCGELYDYCAINKIDYESMCINYFGKDFYNMCIVDYILHNTDRHVNNYYFYMDNRSGDIKGLVPLFDHSESLIAYSLGTDDKDVLNQVLNDKSSMRDLFERYKDKCDLSIDVKMLADLSGRVPSVVLDKVLKEVKYVLSDE